nr:multidrug transporter [Pseudomonas duriflava]
MTFLIALVGLAPAQAASSSVDEVSYNSGNPSYTTDANAPKGYAMIGDLLIARPLLIAATAIGAGAFVVSLPFTLLGGNVGEAGQALVVEPGKAAFVRCLGCTRSGYGKTE